MTEFLTVNMPEAGSKTASVTGSIDALGLLANVLSIYRDKAPDDQWRGIVTETQSAVTETLTPYTWEDEGSVVETVHFPRAAIAVVAEASRLAESQYRAIRGVAP